MNTHKIPEAPGNARPLAELLAWGDGCGWRSNGPTVTTANAWNLTVAIVPAQDDPRPTPDALCRNAAERATIVRLVGQAPDLFAFAEFAGRTLAAIDAMDPNDGRIPKMLRALALSAADHVRDAGGPLGRVEPGADACRDAVEEGGPSATEDR